ncbi:MAG: hypothetical protein NC311_18965 [Muribaculaceae bacterium]|nr:hypothetical protein [Muribaculaceae bacterium]
MATAVAHTAITICIVSEKENKKAQDFCTLIQKTCTLIQFLCILLDLSPKLGAVARFFRFAD